MGRGHHPAEPLFFLPVDLNGITPFLMCLDNNSVSSLTGSIDFSLCIITVFWDGL